MRKCPICKRRWCLKKIGQYYPFCLRCFKDNETRIKLAMIRFGHGYQYRTLLERLKDIFL